jgi:hypothetical protein
MIKLVLPLAGVTLLLVGCLSNRVQRASQHDVLSEAQMDSAVIQAIQDFDRAQAQPLLYCSSAESVGFVLPASAEKVIAEGGRALPALKRHSSPVSRACAMIVEAKYVHRARPRPRVVNGVELLCYYVSYSVVPSAE